MFNIFCEPLVILRSSLLLEAVIWSWDNGFSVPIPTLPLPDTNIIEAEAGDCILNKLATLAPLMCKEAEGIVVPIPTLPLPLTNNISACVGEPTLNKLWFEAPEICNIAEG